MTSRDSLTITAYEYIKNEIVSLRLASGNQILEEKIAEQLNMSRSPVRRAIRLLEEEGFVRVVKSKGATVTYITKGNINELCDLRIFLETWALKKSIEIIPEEKLDEAENLFKLSVMENDIEVHHKADRFLHNLFVEYADSLWVGKQIALLETQTHWYIRNSEYNTDLAESRIEHLAIISAIRNRDEIGAIKALCEHLERVRQTFLESPGITD